MSDVKNERFTLKILKWNFVIEVKNQRFTINLYYKNIENIRLYMLNYMQIYRINMCKMVLIIRR